MSRSRLTLLALLSGRAHDYAHLARPLLHSLERTHHFDIEVAGDLDALDEGRARVLLAASDVALDRAQAEHLSEFVRRGGGLVLLHGTLAAWSEQDVVAEMAGWRLGRAAPSTELVIRVDDHPITQRLSPEIRLEDELYMSEGPPAAANVLLRASWRFSDQVVAYERQHGEGRFVQIGLGHGPATYEDTDVQKLVHRAVLFASGVAPAPPVGVGLIGYGAIARGHAGSVSATPGLDLRAACDISPERRELAARELGVKTYETAEQLLRDPDIGLVIVGTPPSVHAEPVVAAAHAGKHVVCEKPFAITIEEADRMIDAATAHHRVLSVYQSRRWDPDYLAMREAIRSGRIGELFYMESFIGGYSHPCDFWHSHEPISGGTIYDWGSHYFDWVLQLFEGAVRHVSAVGHKRVWHDVTNADQVRVDLTFDGGAQATFMQSDIAAALKPKWYVLGTRGAVVGEWREGVEPPADSPASVKVLRPATGGGTHEERLALAPRDEHGFYRNLADHLAWDEPLAVTPQEARRTVAVMEAATRSIAQGGARLEVDI
ncbi:MAG TPA: Gfo/Idh/MocA family oxidoreductase [Candidatus Dormibacteraeota bacterium]|nr:Gfo/Idh/MocA family oxidoreductase [Candidatus Dormibacteraeota bacterium]